MRNPIIYALGRTQRWSMIKSQGLNISSKADMTAIYQQAAGWKNGGICGIVQEKEKCRFRKERTMLIIWCANSWPWISLRWKFWKKGLNHQKLLLEQSSSCKSWEEVAAFFKMEIHSVSKNHQRSVGWFAFQSLISSAPPVVPISSSVVIYH